MDINNLKGLMEAYSQVYASQEVEQIDELSADLVMKASKAADEKRRVASLSGDKSTAAAKAQQASRLFSKVGKLRAKERKVQLNNEVEYEIDEATAMAKRGHDEAPIRKAIAKKTGGGEAADRATALADKQTFKGSGSARDNLARKQRGDFRKTTSSNPGLHGYAHKSDDPKVKEKQSARAAQRSVLTPAEKKRLNREEFDIFDVVLEFLCVEGYAETLEEAEWMMANELDAEDIDAILEGAYEDRIAANNKKYDAARKRAAQRAAARNAARDAGKTGSVPGVGYVTPRRERTTYTDAAGTERHHSGAKAK